MATKANVKGARVQMYIDGAEAPLNAVVRASSLNSQVPILTARTGTTPEGFLVDGHPGEIEVDFIEQSSAQTKRALGILSSEEAALVPGSHMPSHAVRIHNPADGDITTNDLVFPSVVFSDWTMEGAGSGLGGYSCVMRVVRPSANLPDYWVGYTEDPEPIVPGTGGPPGGYEPATPEPLP